MCISFSFPLHFMQLLQCRNVEYLNREGCALGRLGEDHWGTNDERVPRPIAGTPDTGEIQWTREYDVQTYGDLLQDSDEAVEQKWRNIPYKDNEPRWWEPMQRSSPRSSPQTLRPGIIVVSDQGDLWEYLEQFHQGHVSVRQ